MRKAHWVSLAISLLFSLPLKAQYTGEKLLEDVRYRMGMYTTLDDFKVYALAECKGPFGDFTTLVISDAHHTRFEQKRGSSHSLGLRNAEGTNWHDFNNDSDAVADTALTSFMIGHELHLLTYYPESRFGAPLSVTDILFQSEPAYQLNFKDLKGSPVRVYYSKKGLFPLGFSLYSHLASAPELVEVIFDKWNHEKEVWGFTEARFLHGSDVYEYKFTKLSFAEIPKEAFVKDKALIK